MKKISFDIQNGKEIKLNSIFKTDSLKIWLPTEKDLEEEFFLKVPDGGTTLLYDSSDRDVSWKDVTGYTSVSFIPTSKEDGIVFIPQILKLPIRLDLSSQPIDVIFYFDASLASAMSTSFLKIPPSEFLGQLLSRVIMIISSPLDEMNAFKDKRAGDMVAGENIPGVSLKFSLLGLKLEKIELSDKKTEELVNPEFADLTKLPKLEISQEKSNESPIFSTQSSQMQEIEEDEAEEEEMQEIEEDEAEEEEMQEIEPKTTMDIPKVVQSKPTVSSPPAISKKPRSKMEQKKKKQSLPPSPASTGAPPAPPIAEKIPPASTGAPSKMDESPRSIPSPKKPPAPSKRPSVSKTAPETLGVAPPAAPAPAPVPPSAQQSIPPKEPSAEHDEDLDLEELEEMMVMEDAMIEEHETGLLPKEMKERKYGPLSQKNVKVSWFDRMILQRTYPLTVQISSKKLEKKKSVTSLISGERITEVTETIVVEEEKPVTIRPHFPGCIVTPTERVVKPEEETTTTFYVTPLSKGWMDSRIEFFQGYELIDSIRLKSKVIDHRLSKILAVSGSIVSAVPATFAFLFNVSLQEFFEQRISGISGSIAVLIQLIITVALFGAGLGLYQWTSFRSQQNKTFSI